MIASQVVSVHDGDAILMAQKLSSQLGPAVGISSGALLVQEDFGPDAIVVTVFPDDNRKYLSTDLLRKEPVTGDRLAPHVQLMGYNAMKRVCHTCCDLQECTERRCGPA